MSSAALKWASNCRPGSPARKLVLFALADAADRTTATCFPSQAAIAEFSDLNRKTILAALADLEHAGFIIDTGERVGRTGQVKVYRLDLESVPKTGLFKECRKRNSSENGTLSRGGEKGKEISDLERVPKTEQSQKRDTEPMYPMDTSNSGHSDEQKAGAKKHVGVERPEDVSQQVWDDFLQVRKAKRAPLTPSAMKAIRREVELAGWTLEEALTHCCAGGWASFKAAWVSRDQRGNGSAPQGDFLDHVMRQHSRERPSR